VDATILETHKHTAAVMYDGARGYQPVVVVWAEQDLIVHDEFRDGNVPAGCGNMRILERAVAALPAGVTQRFVRGDSALYEQEGLAWREAPERGIGYAISTDMRPPLRAESTRLPETAWQLDRAEPDVSREWAEVPAVPEDGDHRKDRPCVRRSLAIRVRSRQGELFADGSTVKPVGIVTNREEEDLTLIRWHREKAGTVEHVQHVLKMRWPLRRCRAESLGPTRRGSGAMSRPTICSGHSSAWPYPEIRQRRARSSCGFWCSLRPGRSSSIHAARWYGSHPPRSRPAWPSPAATSRPSAQLSR